MTLEDLTDGLRLMGVKLDYEYPTATLTHDGYAVTFNVEMTDKEISDRMEFIGHNFANWRNILMEIISEERKASMEIAEITGKERVDFTRGRKGGVA